MMTLSEELTWRGFVNQTTLPDKKLLDQRKFKLYFGVDPSSSSMTVGNLASAMMVRCFQKYGHDITLLIGGATGMIGDPSGKDTERNLLTLEEIAKNKKAIANQYAAVFRGEDFRLVDNYDWFKDMNYLDFLRDVGKHFSMTPLLQRDYIATRIGREGDGISYAEFSYTLIQGYDFYYLNQKFGIDLQLCGSDQWGNGLSGVELIRRKAGQEAHVYSTPLVINKATGKKFGKSEEGAVWLDPARTSVYKFYQFWLNSDDEGVLDYLKIFTELPKEEIDQIIQEFEADKSARLAQKTLAYEVTKLVHGPDQADRVKHLTEALFGGKPFQDLDASEMTMLSEEIPTLAATNLDLEELLSQTGLSSSKSEARRFISSGGVYINGQKATELNDEHFIRGHALLRRGKNNVALLKRK